MEDATLVEKGRVLGGLLFSSPFFLTIFSAMVLLLVVFRISMKKKNKFSKLSCLFIYLTIFAIIVVKYNKSILSILDYIVENIFVVIYFPNMIMYIGMLIITNIIMVITVTNKKISSFIKKINIFGFCFMHLLFFLILDSIVSNNIDVYSKMAIYTNSQLLILLELSTGLFVVWMLVLGINFCVNKIAVRIANNSKQYNKKQLAVEEEIDINIIEELEQEKEEEIEIIDMGDVIIPRKYDYKDLTLNDYKTLKSIIKKIK